MQIDLAPHIEQLLYEHDTVALPGLGAFQTQKTSAAVDYAGSSVTPPAKTLIFNENLTTDDGLLMQRISQVQGISFEAAQEQIEAAVLHISTLLNQREIVALAGIGRLYKNYVQKIQFLPDAVNFSRESYGLPPLQFSPIARSREVVEPTGSTATPSVSSSTPTPPPTQTPPTVPTYEAPASSGFSPARLLLTLLLLACSAALGYFVWQRQKAKTAQPTEPIANTVETPTESTDTPTTEEPTPTTPSPTTPTSSEPAAAPAPKPATPTPAPKPANPTTTQGARTCILVIGLFKDPDNIARLVRKIEDAGLKAYQVPAKNGSTTVGAEFAYDTPADIQARIRTLQQLSGEQNIWIKKK
jgi:cell division septation protein DedD